MRASKPVTAPPKTTVLGIRVSAQEFWRDTNTHPAAEPSPENAGNFQGHLGRHLLPSKGIVASQHGRQLQLEVSICSGYNHYLPDSGRFEWRHFTLATPLHVGGGICLIVPPILLLE